MSVFPFRPITKRAFCLKAQKLIISVSGFLQVRRSWSRPMSEHSSFFQQVYEVTRKVPYGRVTTYGAIARYLGSPGAARMVGWAMNQSSSAAQFVPAHRVVNRLGLLTGKHHFEGSDLMQELLENEGAVIRDNQIINMDEMFWDPLKELGL
jgi:methylated-DNA-protein-cysteine methyltransferase-like protein